MECSRIALVVIVLIGIVTRRSGGSSLDNSRFLAEIAPKSERTNQMSPSPSPGPEGNLDSGKVQSPHVNGTKEENCDNVSDKCAIKDYRITACVPFVGNGSQPVKLLILYTGPILHELNATVQPANIPELNITRPGRYFKEVNLNSTMEGNSSIMLKIGNKSCEIRVAASVPQGFYNYITPKYGAYLLFVAAVFAGGTWACCKLMKRKRHLDGVPYQELEMGQQETDPSFVIESPEGWDENWDDDWDEEKAVRSPGARKSLQNGASLKYIDTSQWGNDWDD